MEPLEAYTRLRVAIPKRPELRSKEWPNVHPEWNWDWLGPYRGACYIGTQVFCHLVPEAKPYTLSRGHFWAQIARQIWDPTEDQFERPYSDHEYCFPHHKGNPTHFKTFSKRSQELLKEVLATK